MRDAFITELSKLAQNDPDTVLITGDLGFGVLTDFAKRFPNQFINAGVAEQNMTALACGMAMEGCKVYTYSIGNFPTLRCLEQIRNDICYHDANVTIVAVGGGFSYGQLGMSHFATEDIAIMRSLPNMQVIIPGDPEEATQLTSQMHAKAGPKYLRIDKSGAGFEKNTQFLLGKPTVIGSGLDIVLFATGGITREALAAAEILRSNHGYAAKVVAVNYLKPLNKELVSKEVTGASLIVTVEEHSIINGFGTSIREVIADAGFGGLPFYKFGINDCFSSIVGDQLYLREHFGLLGHQIAADILMKLVAR